MDERYDPAYQRGSTPEPAQQPKTRAGGRIRESAAHPRKHPLHETEHWQPAGTRSAAPHLGAADSTGRAAQTSGQEANVDEGIDVFRPLGIIEDERPDEAPAARAPQSAQLASVAPAVPAIPAGKLAATVGRSAPSAALPRSAPSAAVPPSAPSARSAQAGDPVSVDAVDAPGNGATDGFDPTHPDDDQAHGARNPWEGALWVVGIGLVLFGAFATWQSIQRSMYGWSDQTGPPADYLTNAYLGQLAPTAITIGLATIVGLLFRRLFAHDRRSRP